MFKHTLANRPSPKPTNTRPHPTNTGHNLTTDDAVTTRPLQSNAATTDTPAHHTVKPTTRRTLREHSAWTRTAAAGSTGMPEAPTISASIVSEAPRKRGPLANTDGC
jgi:hypothetical protein